MLLPQGLGDEIPGIPQRRRHLAATAVGYVGFKWSKKPFARLSGGCFVGLLVVLAVLSGLSSGFWFVCLILAPFGLILKGAYRLDVHEI